MIHITGKTYEVITDHKNGWNAEAFKSRYSDVLDRYDYIIGDWGYSQLRLKGFFRDNNPKSTKDSSIMGMVDYINEYCNFGCAYFVLEKTKEVKQDKAEKSDKQEKVEKTEKLEKAEKLEKLEKPDKSEKLEKPDKSDKPERPSRPDRPAKFERADRSDKAAVQTAGQAPAKAHASASRENTSKSKGNNSRN